MSRRRFEREHRPIGRSSQGRPTYATSVRNSLLALPLLLSLAGCPTTSHLIRPPEPEQLPAIQNPLSPVTDSIISFPIQIDLSPFLDHVNDESVIPKTFDHWGSSLKHPKGAGYKYYAERDDFAMDLSGSRQSIGADQGAVLRDWWKGIDLPGSHVSVSAPLRYKIRADPQAHAAGFSLQCGDDGDWPRRATLQGRIAIEMTPNYDLSASVRGVTVDAGDPCAVRIADIDIAQEVKKRLADVVSGGLNDAVARINAMTVKSRMEDVWSALRQPIPLQQNVWLLLNIDKIGRRGFSGTGRLLDDTMHITAKPLVVFGAEPPSSPAALPPLDTRPPAGGFRVVGDIQLEYASLSKALAKRLMGKGVQIKDERIVITNASIFGHGGNQVVIRIDFAGESRGHVYLVGKPEITALKQTISFSGLRYDPATEHFLRNTAPHWLHRSALRDLVASEAVLEVTPATDQLRNLLTPALNRSVNQALSMHGTVASVQGIGVFADVDALYVRAMSDGTLSLTVADKQ